MNYIRIRLTEKRENLMLKVRRTYSFDYKRHTYVGKLLKVRDVTVDQLSWATMFRRGEPTRRSQFLHTFKCANGRIISTYDEGMSNVKRLGPLRRLAVWFSGIFRVKPLDLQREAV